VNANLEVEGMQGIWALGDCALIPDPAGGFCPPTAQHASREGKVLASNIIAGTGTNPCELSASKPSVYSLPSVSPRKNLSPTNFGSDGRLRLLFAAAIETDAS
jgi:NADH dehydrogenase FAD-containing subunit